MFVYLCTDFWQKRQWHFSHLFPIRYGISIQFLLVRFCQVPRTFGTNRPGGHVSSRGSGSSKLSCWVRVLFWKETTRREVHVQSGLDMFGCLLCSICFSIICPIFQSYTGYILDDVCFHRFGLAEAPTSFWWQCLQAARGNGNEKLHDHYMVSAHDDLTVLMVMINSSILLIEYMAIPSVLF